MCRRGYPPEEAVKVGRANSNHALATAVGGEVTGCDPPAEGSSAETYLLGRLAEGEKARSGNCGGGHGRARSMLAAWRAPAAEQFGSMR
jgi:hypothetical protein